jgi:hypothetical protein
MSRYHNPAAQSARAHRHIRTIIEGAHQITFRTRELLIGRQVQAGLDLSTIEQLIVFASHDKRQSGQIHQDGSCPILSIQAQQGTLFGMVVRASGNFGWLLPPDATLPGTHHCQDFQR